MFYLPHFQVAFSDPGDKKDVVTLRGPREDVDKCATYLKKLYVDLVCFLVPCTIMYTLCSNYGKDFLFNIIPMPK